MTIKLLDLLVEVFAEQSRISTSQQRIQRLQTLVAIEKEKLQKARAVQQRKRELEKNRQQHERDAELTSKREPQVEATKKSTGIEAITNQRGNIIGYRQQNGKQTTFISPKGKVIAREIGGKTYDHRGTLVGAGNQGLRQLGQTPQE